MRVRFWGARGSLAKPGPSTLRYGGNTSCVEVRTAAGTLIIIDCGTGLHGLGQALLSAEKPTTKGHVLISHTHWDHIQGIPFFAPFFVPQTEWDVYGPKGIGQSLRDSLAGQMQYAYFPVALDQLNAQIRYHELVEGTFQIEDVTIKTRYLNHPALTVAYRLEADGASMVYASDHEPHSRELAGGEGQMLGEDLRHCEFLAGADLVIHDAQYTAEEYPTKLGWGHSTVEYALAVCRLAGAKRLALTHHDPLRSDDAIDRLIEKSRANLGDNASALDVFAAAEGQSIDLIGSGKTTTEPISEPAICETPALIEPILLLAVEDAVAQRAIIEAAQADEIRVVEANGPEPTLRAARSSQPSLIILEQRTGGPNALEQCKALRRSGDEGAQDVPIIVVADAADLEGGKAAGVTDWLVKPFSSSYARTRISAWLLRTACRWQTAPLPEDEEKRLTTLQGLGILDTPQEARFDRLTRLAAAILGVPVALISFVDKDRQWFKSAHGLKIEQTSREASFCAHAVVAREMLIVPDALQDARFADNPLVTGGPRIRFYAGLPLFIEGSCVGTLCACDTRPRHVDAEAVSLLRDLAILAELELQRANEPGSPSGQRH
jgi:phosphoribosyl 1,2-cyclic phosphodiesterase/DNA-binding response OmpR family regulator